MTIEGPLNLKITKRGIETLILRERRLAFQAVASVAVAGGSGLVRMTSEGLSEEVKTLLGKGSNFLLQVRLDAKQCLDGVRVGPGTTIGTGIETHYGSSFRYHPGEIFWGIATGYQDEVIPKQGIIKRIVKETDRKATKLLPLFEKVMQGEMPTEKEIRDLLEEYRRLSAPYLVMSQRATSDFIRRNVPTSIGYIYGTQDLN